MFAFKNTAFLASLVTCGIVICSTAYYAQSTAIESGMLSEKQLSDIYGGREVDCEETDNVAGCGTVDSTSTINGTAVALEWEPPEYDPDDREASSKAYLESIPDCPSDIDVDYAGGASATGADAEASEKVDCHFFQPYTRSIVQNAVAGGDLGLETKCIEDPEATTYCAICTLGEVDLDSEQAYTCPEDDGG